MKVFRKIVPAETVKHTVTVKLNFMPELPLEPDFRHILMQPEYYEGTTDIEFWSNQTRQLIFRELLRIWDCGKEKGKANRIVPQWLLTCSTFNDGENDLTENDDSSEKDAESSSKFMDWELNFDGDTFKALCCEEVARSFHGCAIRIQSVSRGNRLRVSLYYTMLKKKMPAGSRFKIVASFKSMLFEKSRLPLAQPKYIVGAHVSKGKPQPKSDFPPLEPLPNRTKKATKVTNPSKGSEQSIPLPPRPPSVKQAERVTKHPNTSAAGAQKNPGRSLKVADNVRPVLVVANEATDSIGSFGNDQQLNVAAPPPLTRREIQKLVRQKAIAGMHLPEHFFSGGVDAPALNYDVEAALDDFLHYFVRADTSSAAIISARNLSEISSRSSSSRNMVDTKLSDRNLLGDVVASSSSSLKRHGSSRYGTHPSEIQKASDTPGRPSQLKHRSLGSEILMNFELADFVEEEGTDSSSGDDDDKGEDADYFPFERNSFLNMSSLKMPAPAAAADPAVASAPQPDAAPQAGVKTRLLTKVSTYNVLTAEKHFSEIFLRLQRVRHLSPSDVDTEMKKLRVQEENTAQALHEEEERLLLNGREMQLANGNNELLRKGADFWNRVRDFGQSIDDTEDPDELEEALTMAIRASVPLLAVQTAMRIIYLLKHQKEMTFDHSRLPLQVIVNTALTFEKDEEVASTVLDILLNLLLLGEGNGEELTSLKRKLVEYGGCELLVRQINQNMSRFRLVSKALKAMYILATDDDEIRLRFGSVDTCATLTSVLKECIVDVATIDSCLLLIATLCIDCIGNQDRFNEAKTCTQISIVFAKHMKREHLVASTCDAVVRLCGLNHTLNQTELGSTEMLESFSKAFKLHEASPRTIEKLCCCIAALTTRTQSSVPTGLTNYYKSDIVDDLLGVMERPSSTRFACIAAMWAITDIIPSHPNTVVKEKFIAKFTSYSSEVRLVADREIAHYISVTSIALTGNASKDASALKPKTSFVMKRGLGSFYTSSAKPSPAAGSKRLLSRESSFISSGGSSKGTLDSVVTSVESSRRKDKAPVLASPSRSIQRMGSFSVDRRETILRTQSIYKGNSSLGQS